MADGESAGMRRELGHSLMERRQRNADVFWLPQVLFYWGVGRPSRLCLRSVHWVWLWIAWEDEVDA